MVITNISPAIKIFLWDNENGSSRVKFWPYLNKQRKLQISTLVVNVCVLVEVAEDGEERGRVVIIRLTFPKLNAAFYSAVSGS